MPGLPVPILDLKAQYDTLRPEIHAAIDRVLESQQFILGPEVEALESEIAQYCQCKHAVGVSSGTDALLLALMAVGIRAGDEVITTPYTFFATAGSIVRLGARPVFVDIDPATFNIRSDQVESVVTERTRAIIPVHLAGQMAVMDPIMQVAEQHSLWVIEDACQAIGSEENGRRAGSVGHFGCFSFFPSKNLGAYGDSGMVTTNDPELDDKLRLLRNHGHRPKYYNKAVGGNFRMDAIQAAVLRAKFPHLESWTEARRSHAVTYQRLFKKAGLDHLVHLPEVRENIRHIYHLFMVRVPRRAALIEFLRRRQIGTEIYYPVPLHLQECFSDFGYKPGSFPESERIAQESLALPIYPELTEAMQQTVVDAFVDFYQGMA